MSLLVQELFAGTNYMEDLAFVPVDKLADQGYPGSLIKNTPDSIFNKFSVFGYARSVNGAAYDPRTHFIGYDVSKNSQTIVDINNAEINSIEQRVKAQIAKIAELEGGAKGKAEKNATTRKKSIEKAKEGKASLEEQIQSIQDSAKSFAARNTPTLMNPTASNIIKWSKEISHVTDVGFQPYSMTDFVFCKYYGKIPNNRLVTLRRYPFPIDDSFRAFDKKQPIPIAQAVTWFGGDTANALTSIGVQGWDMPWEEVRVDEKNVTGNEVLVTDLIAAFKKSGSKSLEKFAKGLEIAYVAGSKSSAKLQQINGMEARMQKYLQELYTTNGPYWNRTYGPVNVVHKSTKRSRGVQTKYATEFSLNFHYSFRSFNGLSPKIVALDLISSFLNLTYNDAQFLGQLNRYFANPGLKFDPATSELIGDLLTKYATTFDTSTSSDIMKITETIMNSLKEYANEGVSIASKAFKGDFKDAKTAAKNAAQVTAMVTLMEAVPKFISARAALSDRPVGEWHLVVGNPMNPIMVMGDIICKSCTMKFDEELGPDDFPTGVTFTVALQQGKPRDKAAIERMFNLGRGKMMNSKIRNPSSANDTFGEKNNEDFERITKAVGDDGISYIKSQLGYDKPPEGSTIKPMTADEKQAFDRTFVQYRNRIRKSYGYASANTSDPKDVSGAFDDSLLWLYFDRGQERN
jgi:hypothetical protein